MEKRKNIHLSIREDVLEKLEKKLEFMGCNMTWFVEACMEDYVKGHFRFVDGEVEDHRLIRKGL